MKVALHDVSAWHGMLAAPFGELAPPDIQHTQESDKNDFLSLPLFNAPQHKLRFISFLFRFGTIISGSWDCTAKVGDEFELSDIIR